MYGALRYCQSAPSSAAASMSLACYALAPQHSLGRLIREPEDELRNPHQRDRDRILHSTAFRRLMYKTQVFVNFEGDHFRTRLTHSLEVAQITRTVCRALGLNEDLGEAIALAHDLGHPPFGHAGEEALAEVLKPYGGFDHNLQTFRILTALECRYAAFDGLNLTAETLEGVVKHNGPLDEPWPEPIAAHPLASRMNLGQQAHLEAQVAAVCDDIAYSGHDVDDGIRAGFIAPAELRELALAGPLVREVERRFGALPRERFAHELVRRLIDVLVRDLLAESRRRLARVAPRSPEEARAAGGPLVAFSEDVGERLGELRSFLRERVYCHYKVARMTRKAQRVVRELFQALMESPECLPESWRRRAGGGGVRALAQAVGDYIAGMTDRYALNEHESLFKLTRYPS